MAVTGILGKKIGMTQVFDDKGEVHPITVIKAGPCVITQLEDAGEGRLRRRSDWPCRVREGKQGQQSHDRSLCEETTFLRFAPSAKSGLSRSRVRTLKAKTR